MAIVVVIAPNAAQTVGIAGDTGLFSDVGKTTISVVAIERVPNLDAAAVQVPAIYKINILKPITIIIGDANTRSGLFEDGRDSTASFVVDEANTSGSGQIVELDRRRGTQHPTYKTRRGTSTAHVTAGLFRLGELSVRYRPIPAS